VRAPRVKDTVAASYRNDDFAGRSLSAKGSREDPYGEIAEELCGILGEPDDSCKKAAVPYWKMFNYEDPTYLPAAPRIVVIGDVHGDIARLARALVGVGVINANWEWVASPPDTVVVQMGDQVDSASRLPAAETVQWERATDLDVVTFMDRLDSVARCSGGRALSLIGNHEMMNLIGDYTYVSPHSLAKTGGAVGRSMQFHPSGAMGQILCKRNVVLKIGPLLFVHGGVLPEHLDACGDNLHKLNDVYRRFARQDPLSPADQWLLNNALLFGEGIAWTRQYTTPKGQAVVPEVLVRTQSTAVFIGHNTVNDITCAVDSRLWFTDAMFSRSYGSDAFQVLNVVRVGGEAEPASGAAVGYRVQTVIMRDPEELAAATA